jgi:hypothetical protein
MMRLFAQVQSITGKPVYLVDVAGWYKHTSTCLEISDSPTLPEDLVHEVLHWVVANDEQRACDENLGMGHSFDGYDGRWLTPNEIAQQERVVARLQFALFAAVGHRDGIRARDTARYARLEVSEARVVDGLERCREVGWPRLLELVRLALEAR